MGGVSAGSKVTRRGFVGVVSLLFASGCASSGPEEGGENDFSSRSYLDIEGGQVQVHVTVINRERDAQFVPVQVRVYSCSGGDEQIEFSKLVKVGADGLGETERVVTFSGVGVDTSSLCRTEAVIRSCGYRDGEFDLSECRDTDTTTETV